MKTSPTPLRDLIQSKVDEHWLTWAHQHPHLAEAIDRTRLIDTTVDRLRDDPEFIDAIRRCGLDEHQLAQAANVLNLADRLLGQVLPRGPR